MMSLIITFCKDHIFSIIKYTSSAGVFVICFIVFYKVNSFIKNINSIKKNNILLLEQLSNQEIKIKSQEKMIINYKKILQKEVAINVKLCKINTLSNGIKNMNVQKINKLLNCHIDNFKNLEVYCEEPSETK